MVERDLALREVARFQARSALAEDELAMVTEQRDGMLSASSDLEASCLELDRQQVPSLPLSFALFLAPSLSLSPSPPRSWLPKQAQRGSWW